jgi:hypothetical protein
LSSWNPEASLLIRGIKNVSNFITACLEDMLQQSFGLNEKTLLIRGGIKKSFSLMKEEKSC